MDDNLLTIYAILASLSAIGFALAWRHERLARLRDNEHFIATHTTEMIAPIPPDEIARLMYDTPDAQTQARAIRSWVEWGRNVQREDLARLKSIIGQEMDAPKRSNGHGVDGC